MLLSEKEYKWLELVKENIHDTRLKIIVDKLLNQKSKSLSELIEDFCEKYDCIFDGCEGYSFYQNIYNDCVYLNAEIKYYGDCDVRVNCDSKYFKDLSEIANKLIEEQEN